MHILLSLIQDHSFRAKKQLR